MRSFNTTFFRLRDTERSEGSTPKPKKGRKQGSFAAQIRYLGAYGRIRDRKRLVNEQCFAREQSIRGGRVPTYMRLTGASATEEDHKRKHTGHIEP